MEIHAPESPITSVRDFFIHLGIVTLGILIALSLEGLLEWNHHSHLVREARENIRSEIENNRREISGHLANIDSIRKGHRDILQWIADLTKVHKSGIHSLNLTFNRAELTNTSWTTAQAVGALGLMDYAEAKRDAEVYQLQDEFLRLQSRSEDATIAAMTLFTAYSDDPSKATNSELQQEKIKIQDSLTALLVQEQIGRELGKRYTSYLTPK